MGITQIEGCEKRRKVQVDSAIRRPGQIRAYIHILQNQAAEHMQLNLQKCLNAGFIALDLAESNRRGRLAGTVAEVVT